WMLLVVIGAAGADRAPGADPATNYSPGEARVMLRAELVEFERYIDESMKSARTIARGRRVKSRDLDKLDSWQDAQRSQFRKALRQDDPLVALVDAWAVGLSLNHFIEDNARSADLPENVCEVAVDMLQRRQAKLAQIAEQYLPPESMQALSNQIQNFVVTQSGSTNNAQRARSRGWTAPLFSAWSKGETAVGGILQIPLIPGKALMGVSESGKALTGIRDSTAEALQVANELPERIRKEFELALDDLLDRREELMQLLLSIDSVSTNLRATAEASEGAAVAVHASLAQAETLLPAGESLAVAVARAVQAATELVNALSANAVSHAPVDGQPTAEDTAFDIKAYEAAAVSITSAATELGDMLREIQALIEMSRGPEQDSDEPGFDIRQYGATADSIQSGAAEIRGILKDMRDITDDEAFRARAAVLWQEADASAMRAAGLVKGVVDHVALRLLQLTLAIFVLASLYAHLRARREQRGKSAHRPGTPRHET
ncbi:MAG: hypothetical protein O3B24_02720, partial [Verrucomicrobia bacterium]|nr:hypothetical protein [Verrucomicrobiota bacterium]